MKEKPNLSKRLDNYKERKKQARQADYPQSIVVQRENSVAGFMCIVFLFVVLVLLFINNRKELAELVTGESDKAGFGVERVQEPVKFVGEFGKSVRTRREVYVWE